MMKFWLSTFSVLLCVSPVLASGTGHAPSEMSAHNHEKIEVPEGQPVPQVDLVIHPDASQGWNLEIKVTNFEFAPDRVNQPGPSQEGHAHLYIDGKKQARLYSGWYHLQALPPGIHSIGVALSTNDHHLIATQGMIIADQEILVVDESPDAAASMHQQHP